MIPSAERDIQEVAKQLGFMASLHRKSQDRKDTLLRSTYVFAASGIPQCPDPRTASALTGLAGTLLDATGGEEIPVSREAVSLPWDSEVVHTCLSGAHRACLRHGAMEGKIRGWMDYTLGVLAELAPANGS